MLPESVPNLATPSVAYRHTRALQVVASPGAGSIWAEDVHLTTGGDLRRLMFGYFMNLGVPGAKATLWVFESDAEDTKAPADPVLGPIEFNLIGSDVVYTRQVINFNTNPVRVGRDLWIAVAFNHDNPGFVVVEGDAQVGNTHNIYYNLSTQQTSQLPQPYASNWVVEIRVDPVPTAVEALTWSEIKALFRSSGGTRPTASQ